MDDNYFIRKDFVLFYKPWFIALILLLSCFCVRAENSVALSPEGGSYTDNIATANTLFMVTLHERLGEAQFVDALNDQPEVTSLWLRQVGGHNIWRDDSRQLRTQSNRYVAQLGGDVAQWSTNDTDRWHIGFMAGYGHYRSKTQSDGGNPASRGVTKGYNTGGYATWFASDRERAGAYLDSWVLYSWFNHEVRGDSLTVASYKSHGITASLEGGYSWKAGEFTGSFGSQNEWFIQPQLQAVWMGVRADDRVDTNGMRVESDGEGNLQTRLGLRTWLRGHHARDNEKQREFQPFLELNWRYNTRNFSTTMDGIRVSQDGARHLGEVKVGLEGQISPRLNIWGNLGVQVGDSGYHDSAAMFGIKSHF